MSELRFTVEGPPVPKGRPRFRGHAFTPKRTREYEARVRGVALAAVAAQRWALDPGARYQVELDVYFPDLRRRDLDNACKSALDALNGIAFADDSQVDVLHLRRGIDREAPRIEVVVRRLAARAA